MPTVTLKELVEFYPSYFSAQTLAQGCQEIALVYAQSDDKKQEVREILAISEGLLAEHHPILIELFTDTCIFVESDNDEADFKEIANLLGQIKQKIFEFWQQPVSFKPITNTITPAKSSSKHFQAPNIALLRVAVGMLLNLYQDKSEVGEVQIQRVLSMVESMNKDAITEDNREYIYRDIKFLVDGFWDILKDKKNRHKRVEIIQRALM